jgi:hypothetical protein
VYLEKAFDGTGWRPAERLPVARTLIGVRSQLFCHPGPDPGSMVCGGRWMPFCGLFVAKVDVGNMKFYM